MFRNFHVPKLRGDHEIYKRYLPSKFRIAFNKFFVLPKG